LRGWIRLREVGGWLKVRVPCWVWGAAEGVVTDSRQRCERKLFVGLRGERYDGSAFYRTALCKGAAGALVSSKAASLPCGFHKVLGRPVLAVENANAAFVRLAAAYLKTLHATVVAITGSCGKTTTKEMLRAILAERRTVVAPASHNNFVGVPLTILNTPPNTETLVLEFGTNHRGEIRELCGVAPPDVAVVTTVAPAHIGNFASLRSLWREKTDIIRYAKPACVALVGQVPWLHQVPRPPRGSLVMVSREKVFDKVVEGNGLLLVRGRVRARLDVFGSHFGDCAALAVTAATYLGIPPDEALMRLDGFAPPPMRMQRLSVGSVLLVLDCYNANPASVTAALRWLRTRPPRRFFVFAGMAELGRHSLRLHREVGRLATRCADFIVGVGDAAAPAVEASIKAGGRAQLVATHKEAADLLASSASAGDTVLLKGSRLFMLEKVATLLGRRLEGGGCSGSCIA